MKPLSVLPPRRPRGFTLVELMIVIAIVAVLTLLTWQGYGVYVDRGEDAACVSKMVHFGAALQNYVSEKQTWPQEDVLNGASGKPPDIDVVWDWWYKQMKPFGIDHDDWFCPRDLKLMAKEKKADKAEGKEDSGFKGELEDPSYIPDKFGFGLYAPFENTAQPWLVERGGHKQGMNKLMPNGTVQKEFNFKALRGGGGAQK